MTFDQAALHDPAVPYTHLRVLPDCVVPQGDDVV